MTMTDEPSHFNDAASEHRSKREVFRPRGGALTFEADAEYQLVKIILITADGERRTVCVLDWESAYRFGADLSVQTVSAMCQSKEADKIEQREISAATDAA